MFGAVLVCGCGDAAAAVALGVVERGVGPLEQALSGLGAVPGREAESSCTAPGYPADAREHCGRVTLAQAGISSANSSPPIRASTSSARSTSLQRRAVSISMMSLGVTPPVVDVLEVVDVEHGQAQGLIVAAGARECAFELSSQAHRLGSPVSGSVWARSWSWARRRSRSR